MKTQVERYRTACEKEGKADPTPLIDMLRVEEESVKSVKATIEDWLGALNEVRGSEGTPKEEEQESKLQTG